MGGGFGFEVAANDGFGAAGAEGDPFVVREQKFVAVGGDEFFDFDVPDFVQAFGEAF